MKLIFILTLIKAMVGQLKVNVFGSVLAHLVEPRYLLMVFIYIYNLGEVRILPYQTANGINTIKVLNNLKTELPH